VAKLILNTGFKREMYERVYKIMLRQSFNTRKMLQDILNRPGTGRHYPGQPNRSSAPGEPPARQTGRLRAHVPVRMIRHPKKVTMRIIYTWVKYAPYLEFGTFHIARRPFAEPVMKQTKKMLERKLKRLRV
jgi:hypothetical protein